MKDLNTYNVEGNNVNSVVIRSYEKRDEQTILKLNEDSVSVLSVMDSRRFKLLISMSALVWVAEKDNEVVAFLIGLCDGQGYDSINYRWFCQRLKNFLYVDRIVVKASHRSLGIGRLFYSKLEQRGKDNGCCWLAAEVDIEPPNMNSLQFHDRHNFLELAQQHTADKSKVVSLRAKSF